MNHEVRLVFQVSAEQSIAAGAKRQQCRQSLEILPSRTPSSRSSISTSGKCRQMIFVGGASQTLEHLAYVRLFHELQKVFVKSYVLVFSGHTCFACLDN